LEFLMASIADHYHKCSWVINGNLRQGTGLEHFFFRTDPDPGRENVPVPYLSIVLRQALSLLFINTVRYTSERIF
jgi:hypothetical protein